MGRLGLAILLLLTLCAASIAARIVPAVEWAGDGTRIAVATRIGSTYGIYIFDSEGRQHECIQFKHPVVAIKWPSQDDPMAVVARHPDGKCFLWLAHRSGIVRKLSNRPVYIPKSACANIVSWSPDVRSVVFASDNAGNVDLYRVPVSIGEERRLTATPGLDYEPVWSRDGAHIAFASARSGSLGIWMVSAEGGQARKIIDSPDDSEEHPSWSPLGSKIAYLSNGRHSGIYTISTVGGAPSPVSIGGKNYAAPVWSNTGKWIAFVYGSEPSNIFATSLARTAGLGPNYQTSFDCSSDVSAQLRAPAWAPTHDQLAYATYEDGRLGIRVATLSEKHGPVISYVYTAPATRAKRSHG